MVVASEGMAFRAISIVHRTTREISDEQTVRIVSKVLKFLSTRLLCFTALCGQVS
jgi:hypothetical protein